ncbi:hypothetical protein ASG32_17885 [Methylobacterium sp. Leaf361]|uniref:hypothetical protein n=1 Tax=Methylobacterium sp. Leaf361 TaxID=1736352 RepID=UPI0006FC823D|nr:hypothetical protein [Methylobacterium sp. Leaf361]KQS85141.1 hypothetical protein ASG32_17885 [Methylobacterium sp. Leaf361]
MTDKIIPLRRKSDETAAMARFYTLAAELLANGRAATLTAAQREVLLIHVREQRAKFAVVLEDLQGRPSTGIVELDGVNADLSAVTIEGIARSDELIRILEAWRSSLSIH